MVNVYYAHDIKFISDMTDKIDECINRFLEDKPDGTYIRFGNDEWIIKGTGLS